MDWVFKLEITDQGVISKCRCSSLVLMITNGFGDQPNIEYWIFRGENRIENINSTSRYESVVSEVASRCKFLQSKLP